MPSTFDLAPPPKVVDGFLAVPIDIAHIDAKLQLDIATGAGTGDATVMFAVGPTGGRPVFDLRQSITGLWLDGASLATTAAAHHDFGGGPDAELRILDAILASGTTHSLRVTYDLGHPAASVAGSYQPGIHFDPGGRVVLNFGMTDLGAGRYLEAWVPSNLIYDQFSLDLDIEVAGTSVAHTLITNGATSSLGPNHWLASFPPHTTALSPLVELRPTDTVQGASGSVTLPVSGQTVTIEAWKLTSSGVNLGSQIGLIASHLTANENSTGPYLHGNRFVAFLHVGGMEYDGGTTTGTGPLRHEAFHSWWGRGMKPASQPDAWFDEAWTTYNDFGAVGSLPFDFTDTPVTLKTANAWVRTTAGGAYGDGRRFFEGIAAAVGASTLRTLMADFYRSHRNGPPVTTEDIEEFLLCRTGETTLVDAFSRFVYGHGSGGGDLWLRDEVGHRGSEEWAGRFWDSPDLWIRNRDDDGITHQAPEFGQDNWFHARIRNRSVRSTARHFVTAFNVTGFAGTQFTYPGDFLPCIAAAANHDLGPGQSRIIKARWPAADVPPAGTHACLTAAVIAPADHPSAGSHVWESNNLAQKNLTIVDLAPGDWFVLPFLVRNLGTRSRPFILELHRPQNWASVKAGLLHPSGAPFELSQPHRLVRTRLPLGGAEADARSHDRDHLAISARCADTAAARTLAGAIDVPFGRGSTTQVQVKLARQSQATMGLRLEVPDRAKPGRSFTVDLVKRDARTGQTLGGVAVRINVAKQTPKRRQ